MYDNHQSSLEWVGSKINETTINNKLLWRIRRLGLCNLQRSTMTKNDPKDEAMVRYQQDIAITMMTMQNMMTDRGREMRQR